jgi:ribosomal protein S18 acetylase RimI-like enzyme
MDLTVKNVFIRRMRTDDAEEISVIYESITKEPVGADFGKLVEEHVNKDADAACFVAEQDGKIVGFMISYVLPFGFGIERSAWIATMGVDPKCMGQGIGGRLALEIMSFYKSLGISYLHTSVRWDSTDLLSFFKTLGFDRSNFINLQKSLE